MLVKALQSKSKLLLQSCKSFNILKNPTAVAYISTSKKSKDTASLLDSLAEKYVPDSENPPKNFISWGYSKTCVVEDNSRMHLAFFLGITISFVLTAFIVLYRPDHRMFDWVRREAFLELRRREELGLEVIDKNLIPLNKIELPTDEELGEINIII